MTDVLRSITFNRRRFLTGAAAFPFLPSLAKAHSNLDRQARYQATYINGHHDQAGHFFISRFDAEGKELQRMALPEMPHGFAVDPKRASRLVTFPGLTGQFSVVYDVNQGKKLGTLTTRTNRHFNGHGTYSPDGRFIFATENNIETSEGIIGVYDAERFEFIREIPGHGLGPHGMRISADGKMLIVASGGLRTHPSSGKFYFDMNKMRSAVLFIEVATGKLIARREIPIHRLSIRNIYFVDDNRLLVTSQYYGKREMPKIVGLIEFDQNHIGDIEMLDIDEDNLWLMNNYTGGTVIDGDIAAVSCPRGNHLTFWDLKQKRFISSVKITDVSGVQPLGDGEHFIASADIGKLYKVNYKNSKVTAIEQDWHKVKWTNHMIKI